MTGYADLSAFFSRWVDAVTSGVVSAFSAVGARKSVQVIEEDAGSFARFVRTAGNLRLAKLRVSRNITSAAIRLGTISPLSPRL